MERLDQILKLMATPEALNVREFLFLDKKAVIINHPDITDSEVVFRAVLAMQNAKTSDQITSLKQIIDTVLFSAEIKEIEDDALTEILLGDAVIIVDGIKGYLVISAKKWDKRGVSEPLNETVIRGPKEGFIEDFKTNISLLARRLKTPDLSIEKMKIGSRGNVNIALLSIKGIVCDKLLSQIRDKLNSIDVDSILDSHYLLPLLEPHPHAMFNQIGITEKPDVAAARLLEGRIAIIVDGSPTVLTLPFLLIEDFQSPEDYYSRSTFATFIRPIRFLALILAIILPGLFVALQVFHHNILPSNFLINLQNATKAIPLRPLPEMLLLLLLFEIIKEAVLRMPRAIAMAITIVTGVVLGEAALSSGLFTSPGLLITALSTVALFTVPNQVPVTSLLRLVFVILGGLFGIFGLVIGGVFLLVTLVNFDSFNAPYLAPISPLIYPDLKDSFYFGGTAECKTRPYSLPGKNKTRMKED
ncbi:MAG: spore germination protein [Firmicutes bacterium]|nr:spore germination protein [Bacillota bacterium]